MKYLRPYVVSRGKKNIPINDVVEIRKNRDGLTEVWTKVICVETVRELQDELARKKGW